jgi:phospholipase C
MGLLLLASGCAVHATAQPVTPVRAASGQASGRPPALGLGSVQHVVIIVQENRSVDNMFQGFPGANTRSYGFDHNGNTIPLVQTPINPGFDPSHGHPDFVTEAAYQAQSGGNGQFRMNGFDLERFGCQNGPKCQGNAYTYVQPGDVVNYWKLAKRFAFADMTFQPNMGGSFPAHQYLIAGQSGGYDADHFGFYQDPGPHAATCLNPHGEDRTVDMALPYPGVQGPNKRTCVGYNTILDELDASHITWKYYVHDKTRLFAAPYTIASLFANDPENLIQPETQVLGDIANHTLATVTYVTPGPSYSDHPYKVLTNHGQDWVALITNGIGEDPYYWGNTVVFITWDDWGGFYDHVAPPFAYNPWGGSPNPNEYGMRVPFIVVGPYVIPGTVDHTVRSSAAVLTFMEKVFGLASLGTLDAQSDDLTKLFNFSRKPNVYHALPTHHWTPTASSPRPPQTDDPIDNDL